MKSNTGKKSGWPLRLFGTILIVLPLVYFIANPQLYRLTSEAADGKSVSTVEYVRIFTMLLPVVLGILAVWIPCFLDSKKRRLYARLSIPVTSAAMIFILEYSNIYDHRNPVFVLIEMGEKKTFMTWVVIMLFAACFAVLVNRWQIAAVMAAILVCIFGVICYLVYAMRGMPFLASDLTVLQTAANVAGEYEYKLDYYTLVTVTWTIAWCDIVLWAGVERIFTNWKRRAVAAIVMVVVMFAFNHVCFHTEFLRHRAVTMNTFRPVKSYGHNGAILTFMRSIQMMVVEEPRDYSPEKVEAIEARYLSDETRDSEAAAMTETKGTIVTAETLTETEDTIVTAAAMTETEDTIVSAVAMTETEGAGDTVLAMSESQSEPAKDTASDGDHSQPNIIIVMNEAFTNMQGYMDFETDREVCPFFEGLTENTIRGKLYVPAYGGRTANIEYEVLTGDSVGLLPPSATPYQLYIKDYLPNQNSALKNEGYSHTVGMHPYLGSGYNRETVYEYFGFDKRIFMDDFAEDTERINGRISDKADVERVIAEYEEAKAESDAPFFIHNVTMQNHSPYTWKADDLSDPIHVTSGTGNYPDADLYLTLIHKSDESLKQLVEYFEAVDDPTIILFFGDHQPKLEDNFYEMVYGKTMLEMKGEELMQFYHSDYVIWANFDIEEKEMDISCNYLMPVLKQAAGMELTGYDRFLLDLHEDLPIVSLNGYWDKNGTYYETLDDEDSEWYDRLQEYNMLVYNHLFDEEHRNDEFFGGSVQAVNEAS